MKLILIVCVLFVLLNENHGHHDHRERDEYHGHHEHNGHHGHRENHGHHGHHSQKDKDEDSDEKEEEEKSHKDSKKFIKKLLKDLEQIQNELEEIKIGLKSWKPPPLNESTVFDLPPYKSDVKLKEKFLEEVHYDKCIDVSKNQLDELRKKQYSLIQEGFLNQTQKYSNMIDILKLKKKALKHEIEDCYKAEKSGNNPCDHNNLQSRVNTSNVTVKTLRNVYEDFENHFFGSQGAQLEVLNWEYWLKPVLDCEIEAAEPLKKA